jgi:hypothetical protein
MSTQRVIGQIEGQISIDEYSKVLDASVDRPWSYGISSWSYNELIMEFSEMIFRSAGYTGEFPIRYKNDLITRRDFAEEQSPSVLQNVREIRRELDDILSKHWLHNSDVSEKVIRLLRSDDVKGILYARPGTTEVMVDYYGGSQDYLAIDEKGMIDYRPGVTIVDYERVQYKIDDILGHHVNISWGTVSWVP